MRKMLPLLLTIVMLFSMTFTSAAAAASDANSTIVKAKYVAGTEEGQVISVEIQWSGLEDFVYNGASAPVWDPETHLYSEGTAEGWKNSDASISITNDSNAILQAAIKYEPKTGFESMDLAFTDVAPFIGSADTADGENGAGTPCKVTVRTIPMGSLKLDESGTAEVGEIKVTVAAVEDHVHILNTVYDLRSNVYPESETLPRGTLCVEKPDQLEALDTCYTEVLQVLNTSSVEAEKNAALNRYITAYYNDLRLMQTAEATQTE